MTRRRDSKGRFISNPDPPLVQFQITNPVTYLKSWWKKLIGNEGVDIRVKIKPLTAIILVLMFTAGGFGFGLGRLLVPEDSPIIKYIPQLRPTPTPVLWKETAYTGQLRYVLSTKSFYLQTNQAEAIPLDVPNNIELIGFIGKRILAVGKLNLKTNILQVTEASGLELLPTVAEPIPTVEPTATSTPNPTSTPYPTIKPTKVPIATNSAIPNYSDQ